MEFQQKNVFQNNRKFNNGRNRHKTIARSNPLFWF
jgi:hypothetical protein